MLRGWRTGVVALLFAASLLVGCSSDTSDAPPIEETRWAPTTTPYDPECASGCEVIAEGEFGHVGSVTLAFNPNVDDPVAQWGDCIESFRACVDRGGDALACSESSECPEDCRATFAAQVEGVSELEAQVGVFKAVYLDEGAPCLPPLGEIAP